MTTVQGCQHHRSGLPLSSLVVLLSTLGASTPTRAMYDPHHGRWLQRDPLGVSPEPVFATFDATNQYSDTMSLHEYVKSHPTNAVDPSGLWVIALGGARGIGDGAFQETGRAVIRAETSWYVFKRPCTQAASGEFESFEFISDPAEPWPGLPVLPSWETAKQKLTKAVRKYNRYLDGVLRRQRNGECICPEYLHIIGYSDGASTIAHWLNDGASDLRAEYLGLVGAVDMVRYGKLEVPNALRKSKTVTTYGDSATYVALQGRGLWRGYTFQPETTWTNDWIQGADHRAMPGHPKTRATLEKALNTSMRTLIEKCHCPCERQDWWWPDPEDCALCDMLVH